MTRLLFALALAGCSFDAEVGRQALAQPDGAAPDGPVDEASVRRLFFGLGQTFFVENDAFVLLGAIASDAEPSAYHNVPHGILRFQLDGSHVVVTEVADGQLMVADENHYYVATSTAVTRIDKRTLT